MKNKSLKPGWNWVKFGDVVRQCKDKVDPDNSELERYVAGDHMDTDDLRLRRWGEIGSGYLGPAFHIHFKPGQVLYGSRRTYLRKVAVADFEGICANTTFVLESKKNDYLLPEFLPFLMQTDNFNEYSVKNSKGSVNPYINFSDLAEFEFALPPIEKQLAAITVIGAAKKQCYTLEDTYLASQMVLQAYKENLFKWNKESTSYTLGELLLDPPKSGCSAPAQSEPTGHFVLGLSSLSRDGYISGEFKSVNPTRKMLAAKLSAGDMLISRSNTVERVGYVGIFCDKRDDVSFPDTMMLLNPNPSLVLADFLEAILQTTYSREYLMRIAAGTSASMKKINRANLLQMPLSIPSLDFQVASLKELKRLKNTVTAQKLRWDGAQQLAKLILSKTIEGEA